jgi:hypothetical protein
MRHRLPLLVLLLATADARAELRSLEILSREPFAGGMAFGDTGPYEKIVAVARFAVDPNHSRNKVIVDLDRAPSNREGKVEFEADVCILMPKDPAKGNGALLYDVNNRGNKLALGFFNRAVNTNDPKTKEDAGDAWLFRRGYTVVWSGWIGELLPANNRLLLRAPVATASGKPIRGLVRFETITDQPAETLPLSRREGHGSYPPTEEGEKKGVLTWRMRETDERVVIPRGQWSLERVPVPKVERGVPGTLGQVRLRVVGGFRPGYLYELICECEGPIVQGLGFAAVRDLVSFLRYDAGDHPAARRRQAGHPPRPRLRRVAKRAVSAPLPVSQFQRRRGGPQGLRRRHAARGRRWPGFLQPPLRPANAAQWAARGAPIPRRYVPLHLRRLQGSLPNRPHLRPLRPYPPLGGSGTTAAGDAYAERRRVLAS